MSFLETIRGFGRSSKKNKKDDSPYHASTSNYLSSRNPPSPTRISPSRRKAQLRQLSPSRDSRRSQPAGQALPSRTSISTLKLISDPSTAPPPLFLCEPFNKTALVKGSFKTIVQLPKYVDYGEWLALNIFEFFNHLSMFHDIFAEYMSVEKYPTMNAGPNTDYMWVNSNGQPINLPAAQYISFVLEWISKKLNDQAVFPTSNSGTFPPTFVKDCKHIALQMFRIFAHIYHNHFEIILHLLLEAHWNSFFANYVCFVFSFDLVDRSEMGPLLPLIEDFESQGKIVL